MVPRATRATRTACGLPAAAGSRLPGRYVEPAAPSVRSPARQAWSPLPLRWVYGEHTCPPAPAPGHETRRHSAPVRITGRLREHTCHATREPDNSRIRGAHHEVFAQRVVNLAIL